MDILGQRVLFHLTPEGRKALEGIVSRKRSFPALVVDMASFGPVVRMPSAGRSRMGEAFPVMMLRWDYIATMSFEYRHETLSMPEKKIGF